MCFRMDFLNTKKLFSCISGFYNMFVKLQRVLANIPKNVKILFWGNSSIIHHKCLDKEILKGRISKILLGVINSHTSLKEASIIIEDISKFQIF